MLGLHFIQEGIIEPPTGIFYSKIFGLRQKGDYDDFIDFEESDVLLLIEPASKLLNEIGTILFK